MNIDLDYKLDDLTLIKHLKSIESPFLPKIQEVYSGVKDILNTRIQYVFPNYTLHNTSHSFRIMEYMSKLVSDYQKLNELEIVLLVYSALLHDIGMAVNEEDVELIKNDSFEFCEIKFSAMKKISEGNEILALQEYIRRIHASLSGRYILQNLKEKLVIPQLPSLDFANELAIICESHTQDYDWIKNNLRVNEVRGDYRFNAQYIATILRLADILDIDGNRTPYNLYKLINPKGGSDDEWKQHFIISNNDKIVYNQSTKQKKIVFHGKASNASIHRKLLNYIGWVKSEITNTMQLTSGMDSQYNMVYSSDPEVNIQTEGYTFSDYKMTLEFKAISSLLMGEKIYGSKSLGLRELIQNSMDSCRLRAELELVKQEFGEDRYAPKIKVILDADKGFVIIKDNGIGMSIDVIKKHFLNIGVSYYNSTDFLLKDLNYKPIGNFGIGFLSCFMLSNEVSVKTRHYKSKHRYLIELEMGNEWTSLTETEDVTFDGTEVILNYTDFMNVFENDKKEVFDFLNRYFLTDGIDFQLIDKSTKEISSIHNPIKPDHPEEKGLLRVNFSDYLNEIEGYAIIKRKSQFIKSFDELDFVGTPYRYDDEKGLLEIEDFSSFRIDDYVKDNEIKYLTIPLVESHAESDFLNGLRFTNGDVTEVIEKMDSDLTWISILLTKEYQTSLESETIEKNDNILENLYFEDLENIGHSDSCETKTFVRSIPLFEGIKNDLYLPFDKAKPSWFSLFHRQNRKELFIRGVLIKDFKFSIPVSADIFEIKEIVTNIRSRAIIPDISRNNIDSKSESTLNYAVGKAIHVGAKNLLHLETEEENTLSKFINSFYSDRTDYEI